MLFTSTSAFNPLHEGLSKNRRDDGTMTGQDGASLPQLAAISSPDVKTGRTTGQQLLLIDESVVVGVTEQTQMPVTLFDH